MAGYLNLHASVFSGNLLILFANVNICHSIQRQKLYSWPSAFTFPFLGPTLLMFSITKILAVDSRDSYIHHHHHVVPPSRISLTLSRHFSLSFIASGMSSGLHPVSSHSCCMYIRAGRPAFARPYVGVDRSTSLVSSSLLLQEFHGCLVRQAWIVFVMGVRWPYSRCFVGCCLQDLFNIARSVLEQLTSSFFSSRLVSVQVVHPYSSIDTTAAWKKLLFFLSVRSDFHMINSLSIAVHAFVSRVLMSFSVDETLLPR